MNRDTIIHIIFWIVPAVVLLLFVPRNKIREACLIFSFKQFMTWILGLTVAELKLIEYPVRSFPYATRTSFNFEYFVYPTTCVIFNLNYPDKKNYFGQFMYYFYYCTGLTIIETIVERYTNILNYINWTWYMTWITFFITFYLSRQYYTWFYEYKKRTK